MNDETNPTLIDSKLRCDLYFVSAGPSNLQVGPYQAVAHLYEHNYSNIFNFWYCVADVSCTLSEFNRDADAAGFTKASPEMLRLPMDFLVRLELEDGRWGQGKAWNFVATQDLSSQHMLVAIIRETDLSRNPHAATSP